MAKQKLMRRFFTSSLIIFGLILLISNLLFVGLENIFAVRFLTSPVIFEVKSRTGEIQSSNWISADNRPVVSGFATAVGSKIILYLDDEEVTEEIVSYSDPAFSDPVWGYTFEQDLDVGQVYELSVSEVLKDGTPVGGSEPFLMAVLDIKDEVFMPFSLIPEPTLLPTATPIPSIVNGAFEQGQAGWTFNSNELGSQTITGGNAISGASALIGSPAYDGNNNGVPVGYGEIFQTINVPENGGILTFEYRIFTYDRMFGEDTGKLFDTFEVYLNRVPTDAERQSACVDGDRKPVYLSDVILLCDGNTMPVNTNNPPASPLREIVGTRAISLNNFAGEEINLIVRVYNRVDGSFNTWAYVDDFEIQ